MILLLLSGFTIWMAVEAVRRGQMNPWLWIVLLFGPVGAAVYFFVEYLGQVQLRRRRSGSPVADLRRAEAEVQRLDNASAWGEYAAALRAKKRFSEAAAAAQTAVDKDAGDPHLSYELGRCLLEAGQPASAIEPLQAVLATDVGFDSGEAMAALARAQRESGDVAAALATLEELSGRSSRPRFLYSYAALQAETSDHDGARATLERIVREAEYVPAYLRSEVRPWVRRARQALRQLAG